LESEGPSSAAEALNPVAGAGDSAVVLPVLPFDGNGDADAEGDIEELGEKSGAALIVPPVAAMPQPKPGGSKSVPGEWNKLAREKKLADELAKKAESKGKGPEDGKAVALSPTVVTCCLGARRITSAVVVPDTNKEAEGAKKAGESPEVAPASWRSKAVKVLLPRTQAVSSKGKGVSLAPCTTRAQVIPLVAAAEDEGDGKDTGDERDELDELEGAPGPVKRKADEASKAPVAKRQKAKDNKDLTIDNVVDDTPVDQWGAGEIKEVYRTWLTENSQPSNVVSLFPVS
jgi:hypothetical protein